MERVTIRQVAKEAGVSISAVSKAINDSGELNAATKEHILQVAKRLNYVPNMNGKNLKARQTKTIGLFIPSMKGRFYEVLTDTVVSECKKQGYSLIACFDRSPEDAAARILNQQIDGAIIMNPAIDDRYVQLIEKHGLPAVFLDRQIKSACMGSVLFDSYQDGQTVAKYLLSLGHREFGCMAGPENYYDSRMRVQGFRDVIEQAGGRLLPEHIWQGYYAREDARLAIEHYVANGGVMPSALFAVNDYSAIGCIEALQRLGVNVPQQVSVIGCDDIDIAEFMTPKLTTIHIAFDTMGRLAVESLLAMVHNGTEGRIHQIHGNIVIRDSCYMAAQ